MSAQSLTELFSAVVTISWRAGWLIVVLAALRLAVRGRVPAQVWFAAWILVALRLLLPFSVPVDWSPYNLPPAQPLAMAAPSVEAMVSSPTVESPRVAAEPALEIAPGPVAVAGLAPNPAPLVPRTRRWTPAEIFAALWLTGLAGLAMVRLAGSWSFRRRLRHARPVSDARVAALVAREAGSARAGARIRLVETDAVDAPALYGFVHTQLLLPAGLAAKLTDDELRHVVRHELGHWRRRDLLAQALMQAAVAVHWFNPLAWLAARLARVDCELACDEFVLRREAPGGARAYGATLLKVLGVLRGRRRPVAVVAMLEGKEQLAQRIRMIAGYRASTVGRVVGGALLIAALATASLTREMHAEDKAGATKNPASPTNSAPQTNSTATTASGGTITLTDNTPPPDTFATQIKTGTSTRTLLPNTTAYTGTTTISAGSLTVSPTTPAASNEMPTTADADRQARIDRAVKAYEALKAPVEEQRRKVEQLQQMLQAYKEKNGAVSLDSRRDIVNEKLKVLNLEAVRVNQLLNVAENRLRQVKERREKGGDLTELPFIAAQPIVTQLTNRRVEQQIAVETLNQRYGAKHPRMIESRNTLAQIERELQKAIDTACAQIEAEYQAAVRQHEQVKAELAQQKEEALNLERLGLDYTRLERELKTNEALLQSVAARSLETTLTQDIEARGPERVDSRPGNPASQNAGTPASRDFTISVFGAVNQQGGISFSDKDKPIMLDAIARSGGFAPRADRNAVRVIRLNPDGSRRTHTLTEAELMSGADPIGALQRGDIVVVPEKSEPVVRGQVTIAGQVRFPGRINIITGAKLTVVEAIQKAGGPTQTGDLKRVRVTRVDPQSRQIVSQDTVDVSGFFTGGTTSGTAPELEPEDLVYVRERTL